VDVNQLIIGHEGLKLKLYKCPANKWSLGVGRNVEDRGISESEAMFMFENDLADVKRHCLHYPWFAELSEVRQAAVLDLMFNLGPTRFSGFRLFIEAMAMKQYPWASAELKNSRWYGQVGRRGPRICGMILNDRWPE
jgi:lysozyme